MSQPELLTKDAKAISRNIQLHKYLHIPKPPQAAKKEIDIYASTRKSIWKLGEK